MKLVVFLLFTIVINMNFHSQYYERSKKNLGIYLNVNPLGTLAQKSDDFKMNTFSGSAGIVTKIIPGVELDENGNITSYDIEKQCHSVFRNIKYILEDSGSRPNASRSRRS